MAAATEWKIKHRRTQKTFPKIDRDATKDDEAIHTCTNILNATMLLSWYMNYDDHVHR